MTGTISGDTDVDSRVYISYNGAEYEALLVPGGFTAMLPGEGGGDYAVAWYSGGALTRAGLQIQN